MISKLLKFYFYDKHWHLLQINSNIRAEFEQEPIIAYRQNKNPGDLIGIKKIADEKVVRKNNNKKQLYGRRCLMRRVKNFFQ